MDTSTNVPPPLPTCPPPLPTGARPSISPAKKVLNIVVGGLAALVAGLTMHYVTYHFIAGRGTQKPATAANAPSPDGWKNQTVAGLEFETPPIQLTRTDIMRILPIETQNRTVNMEAYLTEPANPQFQVSVLRTTLKPQFPLDLNGAMRGALQNAAGSAHIAAPEFKFEDTTLGVVPVKRGRFDGQNGKNEIHMEILGLQLGQTMWQVQVAFAAETRRQDAERILKSIRPSFAH